MMRRKLYFCLAMGLALTLSIPSVGLAATTELVSVDNAGMGILQGSTYFERDPALNPDGTYALFMSEGDLFAPLGVDDNGYADIYLRNLQTGSNELISVALDGGLANQDSETPNMSADGTLVAFGSMATNLTTDGVNGNGEQIFLRDRISQTTLLISDPLGSAYLPMISGNGKFVVFKQNDANWTATTVTIYNVATGVTTTLPMPSIDSVISGGASSYANPGEAVIDFSGRHVAFVASTDIATPSGSYSRSDVFLYDRDTDGNGIFDEVGKTSTTRVTNQPYNTTVSPADWSEVNSEYINISGNGRFIIYCTGMPALVADDTNNAIDTFIYDALNGVNQLVSRNGKGEIGNANSEAWWTTHLSFDGRFATITSEASNLVRTDVPFTTYNDNYDVFLLDRDTDNDGVFDEPGATGLQMITVDDNGQQVGGGWDPMVSDDGKKVIFGTFAPFSDADINSQDGQNDAYVRDLSTPVIEVVTAKFKSSTGTLTVKARSDLGPDAEMILEGYGSMKWISRKGFWKKKVRGTLNPGSVRISTPKAWISIPVKVIN